MAASSSPAFLRLAAACPSIEVTFDIDANGIVNVSAKDLGTGKEQQITISGSTALSDDEVDRMVKDAEAHADEDAKRKEEIEARNNCDSLVNATETTLNELGDKVPADSKSTVEAAIAEARLRLRAPTSTPSRLLPRSCSRQATSWPKLPTAIRTPPLLALGLKGMIGKGRRSAEVVQAIREHGAVYFITIGGAAALLAEAVKKKTPVCYEDLGPEAICRLEVENFYAIVGIDSRGEYHHSLKKSRPAGAAFLCPAEGHGMGVAITI